MNYPIDLPATMKQISQEFFNESVQTNMELLDLSVDEAIEETVNTFLIEGVDLSNIVKDMVKYTSGHPSESLVKKLQNAELQDPEFLPTIESLKEISMQDLAHRKLLIDYGLLDFLLPVISKCISSSKTKLAVRILDLLSSLLSGQSLLLNTDVRSNQFTKILELTEDRLKHFRDAPQNSEQIELLRSLYVLLRASCLENEAKRRQITETNIISETVNVLSSLSFSEDKSCLTETCGLLHDACAFLRGMTLDDDMSVEFGQGSATARRIASSNAVFSLFIKLANDALQLESTEPIIDLFLTLSAILTREEFCCQFAESGGVDLVFNTLLTHLKCSPLVSACLALIRTLCGSDTCKRLAGSWISSRSDTVSDQAPVTGPQLVMDAMERYIKNPVIVKQAASTIAAITLRQPEYAERFVSCGAPEFLSKALQLHTSNSGTVRAVCMAIRNCVSRMPDLRTAFVGSSCIANVDNTIVNQDASMERDPYGLEALLNSVLQLPDCADEAKAALRDLGCRVELKELWRGGLKAK